MMPFSDSDRLSSTPFHDVFSRRIMTRMSDFDLAGWLRAWSDADLERTLSYYSPDCRYRDPATRGPLVGHTGLRSHLERVFVSWPEELWEEVRHWDHADGQGLTLHWRATITSPRSGKGVQFEGLDLLRFAGGKIVEQLICFDPAPWRALMPAARE